MDFLGIEDDEFLRGKVPMTKQEVRILALAKAHISPDSIVYDIGAGTGSFSIEAARLAPRGRVFALEKNKEAVALIRANAEKFKLSNIEILLREAPEGMADLPSPDVVLIGGSGRHMEEILDLVTEKLPEGGRIVVTAITVQSLMQCISYMRTHKDIYQYDAIQVQVSRLEKVGLYDMAKALNPIFIVTCVKGVF